MKPKSGVEDSEVRKMARLARKRCREDGKASKEMMPGGRQEQEGSMG